jgi:molybdopterin synthase catalytic subunit
MMVIHTKNPDSVDVMGKSAFVYENGDFYDVFENGERIMTLSKKLNVLEILADMGYECVVLKSDRESVTDFKTPKSILNDLKRENDGSYGAISLFIGIVKGCYGENLVDHVDVDVDLDELESTVKAISEKHGVKAKIHHNLGSLKPKDEIVCIGVMAKTRFDLFKALQDLVETVKSKHEKGLRDVLKNPTR